MQNRYLQSILADLVADINLSQCLGKGENSGGKLRLIIAKFVRYHVRRKVFINKKKLERAKISVTESSREYLIYISFKILLQVYHS